MKMCIDVDDSLVERMYHKYCSINECEDCHSAVCLGDDEVGCFEKYRNKIFDIEFKDMISKMINIMDKV